MENRIKSQANRLGFVVDETAIDQNFLRLFRSLFCASFEQYSIFIHSFIHSSPTLCTLSHTKSLPSNTPLLGFFHFHWLTEFLGAFSLLPSMLHAPKIYNSNNISEVNITVTRLSSTSFSAESINLNRAQNVWHYHALYMAGVELCRPVCETGTLTLLLYV